MTDAPELPTPARTDAALRAFVRRTFGIRGTLRLHRAAFGADLLRAPLNVMLAPLFLATRILALLAGLCRLRRLSGWLGRRELFFETDVARRVAAELTGFLEGLRQEGVTFGASAEDMRAAVSDYAAVRNAVSEMTTTVIVLVSGLVLFHSATPGVMSLAAPVADMRAHAAAVQGFPLGQGMGRMWYGVFPTEVSLWDVAGTGFVLALLGSLVTSFAGIVADPLQVLTGTHRRRLKRLIAGLEAEGDRRPGLAREHLAARLGDVTDLGLSLWRSLR